ncbi:DUF2058 domain-containing protein [Marinimicrobium sp. ABcell2]|uniref:DUF2058 domain-containing protein n=1 Tax=Marinimicrobium sp. ABcell2 TaxID=3069751 RepID=UPI0027B612DA|nr:DUF2058 domain-containing protein [Marinimicrobium sp. ABcell2]MDQ2076247.1 DUF2058 domain-containing protein [Marinimicrobium sp. ABcell2]
MPTLQDQLLKAGLVDAKQAKQVSKEKRKKNKQARRSGEPEVDELKQSAQQVRAQKAERDRELNRQRQEELERKAVEAQIKQLILNHRQPKNSGGDTVEYNFTDDKRIKKIRVSPAVQQQIIRGQLAIVRLGEDYELVPRIVADKIAVRGEGRVVVANVKAESAVEEADDPYKDYVIPDDLMW